MKATLLTIFTFLQLGALAQQETFDLFIFTPPKDTTGFIWKKESAVNMISYTAINSKTKKWCRIYLLKSTISKGGIEQDFLSEWEELIVKNYNPVDTASFNDALESDGWKIKSGATKFTFDKANAMALLTTMSGYDRCASIIATSNSPEYIKNIQDLLSTVSMVKPAPVTKITDTPGSGSHSILGTWLSSESDNSNWRVKNGVMSTIFRQYTFNADGSYTFYSKLFDPLMDKLLLGRESGTYLVTMNNITITPESNILEAWSKKDGRDEWGKKLNKQVLPVETITYQFTKNYSDIMSRWEIILQTGRETKRDGHFSSNNTFSNAYYYSAVSLTNKAIILPN